MWGLVDRAGPAVALETARRTRQAPAAARSRAPAALVEQRRGDEGAIVKQRAGARHWHSLRGVRCRSGVTFVEHTRVTLEGVLLLAAGVGLARWVKGREMGAAGTAIFFCVSQQPFFRIFPVFPVFENGQLGTQTARFGEKAAHFALPFVSTALFRRLERSTEMARCVCRTVSWPSNVQLEVTGCTEASGTNQ